MGELHFYELPIILLKRLIVIRAQNLDGHRDLVEADEQHIIPILTLENLSLLNVIQNALFTLENILGESFKCDVFGQV